ncbi:GNAT family N-acetyltransferase [Natronolimnohabitans innermongolicus]|uniref:N-acetyltransferase GCN5 n=1 Tax=Natronolimnohabitans innermongolicus JCM 12255 TaxID=1227499 RepID=L9X0X8_9EURY|nr:GNAT family N-acetyltransferase [Natronolimnohabitans innermongolicus]ELY54253.1 N-acetyltransferase GCN5 [Natronolimnohabitans innermongolicus JCM 12255]
MTISRVALREATTADAAAIADAHAAAIRELGSESYDDAQVEAWLSNVRGERYPLEEAGIRVVVAERNGAGDSAEREDSGDIVGFGLLDLEPSGVDEPAVGTIGAVYVHPDAVREGVGSAILERLESAAREAGLETLRLTASRNAIDFYSKRGYEGVETVSLDMTDEVSLAALRMRKRLVR